MSAKTDHITVEGFKSLKSIGKLELRSKNILIGANGSGKSNLIGLFGFLRAVREGQLQNYVSTAGGADRILYFGSRTTPKLKITMSFNNEKNSYSLVLGSTDEDTLAVLDETAYFWGDKVAYPSPYEQSLFSRSGGREAAISAPEVQRTASWVRSLLATWRVYHFHDTSATSPMRKTAQVNDNNYLRPDGANLPAFLYFLRERHGTAYSLIQRTVQRVAPYFEDFRLAPSRLNEDAIRLEWKQKNSDAYFDASALSDGTLRFIVLATLFLQPKEYLPSLILVDEPELGLHPYAIRLLGSLVKQAAVHTQILIATQSPQLVDNFQPEDLIVAERTENGTALNRLDGEKLAVWLEDYSLGQLWEKNELGGRPV